MLTLSNVILCGPQGNRSRRREDAGVIRHRQAVRFVTRRCCSLRWSAFPHRLLTTTPLAMEIVPLPWMSNVPAPVVLTLALIRILTGGSIRMLPPAELIAPAIIRFWPVWA